MSANLIFVLGSPGSGKTTVSNHIVEYVKKHNDMNAINISDYKFLLQMRQSDDYRKYFRPSKCGGFYLSNRSVYNAALFEMEKHIQEYYANKYQLAIVEFARSEYLNSLRLFSKSFIDKSLFIYLNVGLYTCMSRVRERVICPKSLNDHYVPKKIFQLYKRKDDRKYVNQIKSEIINNYDVLPSHFRVVSNKNSVEDTFSSVDRIVDKFLVESGLLQPGIPVLV